MTIRESAESWYTWLREQGVPHTSAARCATKLMTANLRSASLRHAVERPDAGALDAVEAAARRVETGGYNIPSECETIEQIVAETVRQTCDKIRGGIAGGVQE